MSLVDEARPLVRPKGTPCDWQLISPELQAEITEAYDAGIDCKAIARAVAARKGERISYNTILRHLRQQGCSCHS